MIHPIDSRTGTVDLRAAVPAELGRRLTVAELWIMCRLYRRGARSPRAIAAELRRRAA